MNVRLYGGLGNQIFQLAAALLMAKKCNHSEIFFDDSSMGAYASVRKNEIEVFFDFSNASLILVKKKSFVHKLRLAKLFPFIGFFVSDRNFAIALNKPCVTFSYLDGYFQDCLTDSDFIFLLESFKPCLLPYDTSEKAPDSCVIHVRGGDFVNLGWDSVASKDYYIRAIQFMINKHAVRSFDIITDDVSYAKDLFASVNVSLSFVNGSMQDDFYNIGSYSFRILSSSTFAFWASALGSKSNPVVIAPEFWSPRRRRNLRLPGEVYL